MVWNWQLPRWPRFSYDPKEIEELEKKFLVECGNSFGLINYLDEEEKKDFIVEILSIEGQKSAEIEGEILERESLQSSIRKHLGLKVQKKGKLKEAGMADLLCTVYESYQEPLTHKMLHTWHKLLMQNETKEIEKGHYRLHKEPMQIVSGRVDRHTVFFEAPPSASIEGEMTDFIKWYNQTNETSLLCKAAIIHVYFESIHPFEDGNGRIGRALVEKFLSMSLGKPLLLAISQIIEKRKKEYYHYLGLCNRSLDVQAWVNFFSEILLQSQNTSKELIGFIIEKSKLLHNLSGKINERQEKALLRMFKEGAKGFSGGLSAENYMKITKTSRATTTRDLQDLVDKKALYKTGKLKHTRYWLNLPTQKPE